MMFCVANRRWGKAGRRPDRRSRRSSAIQLLRNVPEVRTEFVKPVAAPVANKLFECGMIP
jgi:hypothetical protein